MKSSSSLVIMLVVIGGFVSLPFIAGCTVNPLRVLKASVPAPLTKAEPQLEAERRGADLLARRLEAPIELKPVAVALSASLGAPEKPILDETPKAAEIAIKELTGQMVAMQKKIVALNKTLTRYQGMDIEGTGFSLLGPGTTAIVIGLVVLAVACPPALTLMAFAYRRLKATAKVVVTEVENAATSDETKDAVAKIKENIRSKMNERPSSAKQLKNVVLDLKKA